MHGLNGYPCNKGLIIKMNGTIPDYMVEESTVSIGMAVSHPLLCHLLGGQPSADDKSQMNTFEMILTRSVHNSDLKGLGSLRNTEQTLSELNIAINLNRIA